MLRTSASDGRRRAHGSVHRSSRSVANEQTSDQAITVEGPDVDDLRRVRAEFYDRSPSDRERYAQKDMDVHTSRRRSTRTTSAIRGVDVVAIREERRKHDSERRYHKKRLREEHGSDDVYVYRTLDENRGGKTPERHHQTRRRSTVSMIPDRNEVQKIQITSTGPSRRNTDRKTSHPRDPSRLSNSARRANSEVTSRVIHSKPPVSRYFSLCKTGVQPDPDILQSRTASMRMPSSERTPRPGSQAIAGRARRSSLSAVEEKLERKASTSKKNERTPSIFGAIFGVPKLPDPIPEKQ